MAANLPGARYELLDHRGVSKIAKHWTKDDFAQWIFPFEVDMGLLGWTTLAEAGGDHEIGTSLYNLLVTSVKGTALSIVKLVARGHGLEALRRLYKEYLMVA